MKLHTFFTSKLLLFTFLMASSATLAQVRPQYGVELSPAINKQIEFQIKESLPLQASARGLTVRELRINRAMADFYQRRNYRQAWFGPHNILKNNAISLLEYLQLSPYSHLAAADGLHDKINLLQSYQHAEMGSQPSVSLVASVDMALTRTFMRLGQINLNGVVSPEEVPGAGWFIPGRQANLDLLLTKALAAKDIAGELDSLLPRLKRYRQLNDHLLRLEQIARQGGWPVVPAEITEVEQGDTSTAVPRLKVRLAITGDLAVDDGTSVYTESLAVAVGVFQSRHGLKVDGKTGNNTLRTLNITVLERIAQIKVNIERAKWLPDVSEGNALVVNVPEYKLYYYRNGRVQEEHNVVVGTKKNKTVTFSSKLQNIVLNPYWNVPVSIARNELVPKAERNSEYLQSRNYEIVSYGGGTVHPDQVEWSDPTLHNQYRIRQRPGPGNALGTIKFNFPNQWAIYLHDTPSKSLFKNAYRAYSHGCIRVEDPVELASTLLQGHPAMQEKSLWNMMSSGDTQTIMANNPVDVHLIYMTAWVDDAGMLHLREDIYKHDAAIASKLPTT